MKVGRVAIITRGRYAGKKVRRDPDPPRKLSTRMERDERPANEGLGYERAQCNMEELRDN